jgi:TPR repeat protein
MAVSVCFLFLAYAKAVADGTSDVQAGILAFDHGSDEEAWNYFGKAAQEGNTEANYWLGQMSELGLSVKSDPEKAATYYQTAAAAGWSIAKAKLGHLYLTGEGVSQDYLKARSWLEQAARDNISDAQYDLGRTYEEGLGTTRNPVYAYIWYDFAARGGNPQYREARDRVSKTMAPDVIAEAQMLGQSMRGEVLGGKH